MRRLRSGPAAAVLVAAVLLLAGCGSGGPEDPVADDTTGAPTFANPVADLGNDPYVVEDGDRYLMLEARSNGELWLTASEPDNLTDLWSGTRQKIWEPAALGPACRDVWAPEIHHGDGTWFVYLAATSCDGDNANHRMYVLESEGDDPFGPYVDHGQITDETDRWAIDGTVLDHEGQQFFVWSGWEGEVDGQQNLYIAQMDGPTSISGPRVLLSEPTEEWERQGMPVQEGPQVLERDGALHLVYSTSASWTDDYAYGLLTLTGDDVLDPASWTKSSEPAFSKTANVLGPGHGSFVLSPDGQEDWMVYHATRTDGWDRMIFAQRFTWGEDGTPDLGVPVPADVEQAVPSGQVAAGR